MTEKFRKIVAVPENSAKQLRKIVEKTNPSQYVKNMRNAGKALTDEIKSPNIAAAEDVTKTVMLTTAKGAAWLAAGGSQFLLWLGRVAALDNAALRKLEDNYKNKDKGGFRARYPNLSAHIVWYFALAVIGCGIEIYDSVKESEPKQKDKKELIVENEKESVVESLNPIAVNFIDKCIELENIVCIPLVYVETYCDTPKINKGEIVWTHGYGMTWSPDDKGRMRIRDYVRDTVLKDGTKCSAHKPAIYRTKDQDIEEAQRFLKDAVYPKIKKNMKREITRGEFYAICIAGYQFTNSVSKICRKLNVAQTPQEIADAFIPKNDDKWGGTTKRRWVSAMLAIGAITIEDILDADIDNFYNAKKDVFIKNGHFVCDTLTINNILKLKHKKSTRAEIMELADGRLGLEQLYSEKSGRTIVFDNNNQNMKTISVKDMIANAQKKLDRGKLPEAEKMFQDIIAENPDNIGAYKGLVLTYKKMGDKEKSVEHYEQCCNVVRRCNQRMNAKKSLAIDYETKADLYFNAGLAREAMADIYAANGNKEEAKKNYKLASENFEIARANCLKVSSSKKLLQRYDKAKERVDKRLKKIAYISGQKNITDKIKAIDARLQVSLSNECLAQMWGENEGLCKL